MGLHYSFVDDESYGTEDINNITGELTGAGIAPFPTKDSYSTSDLNGLTSALVGSGTSLDGCKCTYSAESGTVTVAQGIIFFGNGTRLRVDADGYSLSVTDGTAGYVYAVCNTAVQMAEIKFAAALPISGDYVALCELTADGNIYDKRVFARSKVATFGTNATMQADIEWCDMREVSDGVAIIATVTSDISKFNYAVVQYQKPGSSVKKRGLFNLKTGLFEFSPADGDGGTNYFYGESYTMGYYVEMIDGILCVTTHNGIAQQPYITMTLI